MGERYGKKERRQERERERIKKEREWERDGEGNTKAVTVYVCMHYLWKMFVIVICYFPY